MPCIVISYTKQLGGHNGKMPRGLVNIVIQFRLICRCLIGKVKFTRSYQGFQITRIEPPGLDHDRERFNNFMLADFTLLNLGKVETQGLDLAIDWLAPGSAYGQFGINWSATRVERFRAVSKATGLAEPRGVGVEVADSGIPRWRSSLRLNWEYAEISASWAVRYVSKLTEQCGDAAAFPSCGNPDAGTNTLSETFYHDVRASWRVPGDTDLTLTAGINNLLDEDPPVCVSCSLNGYDASVYDLPGQFAYLQIGLRY